VWRSGHKVTKSYTEDSWSSDGHLNRNTEWIASFLLTGVLASLPSATFIVLQAHVHTDFSASPNVLFPYAVIIGLLPFSMWSISEFSVVCFYSGERPAVMFAVTPIISF